MTGPILTWSLVAGLTYGLALVALTIIGWQLASSTPDIAEIDQLVNQPLTTTVPLLLVGSLVAGAMEQAAFRGYMQQPLEIQYAAPTAIGVVAAVFALAHLPHPFVLPIFALAATGWGVLAYFGQSILIPVVVHTMVDAGAWIWFVVAPDFTLDLLTAQVPQDGVTPTFVASVLVALVSGGAAVWAMTRLAAVARPVGRNL